jgi:hypothetical protein
MNPSIAACQLSDEERARRVDQILNPPPTPPMHATVLGLNQQGQLEVTVSRDEWRAAGSPTWRAVHIAELGSRADIVAADQQIVRRGNELIGSTEITLTVGVVGLTTTQFGQVVVTYRAPTRDRDRYGLRAPYNVQLADGPVAIRMRDRELVVNVLPGYRRPSPGGWVDFEIDRNPIAALFPNITLTDTEI